MATHTTPSERLSFAKPTKLGQSDLLGRTEHSWLTKRFCSGFVVWLMASVTLLAATTFPAAANPVADEQQFVQLVNELRSQKGLNPLQVDSQLRSQARSWSQQMANKDNLVHSTNLSAGITADWRLLGENIGVTDDGNVQRLFDAFVASPAHYKNLVDPQFQFLGIGVVHAANGKLWTTHRFMATATPRQSTPATNAPVASSPAQSPSAQSPAAQSPAAQSPAAQSPAAQSPAVPSAAAPGSGSNSSASTPGANGADSGLNGSNSTPANGSAASTNSGASNGTAGSGGSASGSGSSASGSFGSLPDSLVTPERSALDVDLVADVLQELDVVRS